MAHIDLSYLRNKSGLTQQEVADRLSTSKATISNWEANPQNVTLEKLAQYLAVVGGSLGDLEVKSMTKIVDVNGNEELLKFQKEIQEAIKKVDVEKANVGEDTTSYFEQVYTSTIGDLKKLQLVARKPRVLIVGPSDSGKSTFINDLLLQTVVPAHWTPATGMTIKILHSSEKPEWLLDNTIIVKEDLENDGATPESWDLRNREFYDTHVAETGDRSLIDEYGEREGDLFDSDKALHYVIFTYVDSPILNTMEIWDTPGTDAGGDDISQRDEQISLDSRNNADAIVYLMQSNSFMHGQNFSLLRKDIEKLPMTYDKKEGLPVLANLFVVASQADIIGQEGLDKVLPSGANRFYKTITDGKIGDHKFTESELAGRFFGLSNKDANLSEAFLNDFARFLVNAQKVTLSDATMMQKDVVLHHIAEFGDVVKTIEEERDNHDALVALAEEKRNNLPGILKANTQLQNDLLEKVDGSSYRSKKEFTEKYDDLVSTDTIVSMIEAGDYGNNKDDKEAFASMFTNKLSELHQDVIKKHTEAFTDDIDEAVRNAQIKAKVEVGTFDYSAAVKGLVASGLTIGAFAAYAATITSNLGLYILVAQIGGLLTSAGIISSPIVATTVVSALGGPVAWVIGIAVIIGTIIAGIFNRNAWKNKFAKQIIDSLDEQDAFEQYQDALDQVWADTKEGIRKMKQGLDMVAEKDVEITEEKATATSGDFDAALGQVDGFRKLFERLFLKNN
ncbi:dynamin family protein [Weissella confusa]|uniref:dynamin family protein n=1 Tax=Weissella confusa TaxID=1583 RepID=UPI0021A96C53|nr:dynamin family protein [Weissella confusa]MCT2911149.1 helix-turn-helix domain-containing protein [Weissella confusa]